MTGLFGLIAAGYGISTALRLRAEEEDGRAELVVSSARSRVALARRATASPPWSARRCCSPSAGCRWARSFGAADGDALAQAWRAMLVRARHRAGRLARRRGPDRARRRCGPPGPRPRSWLVLVWFVRLGLLRRHPRPARLAAADLRRSGTCRCGRRSRCGGCRWLVLTVAAAGARGRPVRPAYAAATCPAERPRPDRQRSRPLTCGDAVRRAGCDPPHLRVLLTGSIICY